MLPTANKAYAVIGPCQFRMEDMPLIRDCSQLEACAARGLRQELAPPPRPKHWIGIGDICPTESVTVNLVSVTDSHIESTSGAVVLKSERQRMGVVIVPGSWFDGLEADLRDDLIGTCGQAWSAGSIVVDGRTHVLLNPAHTETRRSASLGEELMHVALGHPASTLQTIDGVPIRTCRQDMESEAYAVAIALLLPYRAAFHHLNIGGEVEDLPATVPVSDEARRYRVKVAGLWRMAQARAKARARAFA